MDLAICRHIKMDRIRCGSPAMRGQHYCYFHAGAHRAIPSVNLWPKPKRRAPLPDLSLPQGVDANAAQQDPRWQRCKLTGDRLAIQVGFSRLAQGLWQGLLSVRQGRILLSALHQAAARRQDGIGTRDLRAGGPRHQFRISDSPGNIQSLSDYNKRALPLATVPSATVQRTRDESDDRVERASRPASRSFF